VRTHPRNPHRPQHTLAEDHHRGRSRRSVEGDGTTLRLWPRLGVQGLSLEVVAEAVRRWLLTEIDWHEIADNVPSQDGIFAVSQAGHVGLALVPPFTDRPTLLIFDPLQLQRQQAAIRHVITLARTSTQELRTPWPDRITAVHRFLAVQPWKQPAHIPTPTLAEPRRTSRAVGPTSWPGHPSSACRRASGSSHEPSRFCPAKPAIASSPYDALVTERVTKRVANPNEPGSWAVLIDELRAKADRLPGVCLGAPRVDRIEARLDAGQAALLLVVLNGAEPELVERTAEETYRRLTPDLGPTRRQAPRSGPRG
jgi:hypothetical protein